MAQRIYTQEDKTRVNDLYNEYQAKKDSYTPEQQQKIENAFNQVNSDISQSISERHIIDMYWKQDEPWRTYIHYNDWTMEVRDDPNYVAPTPSTVKRTVAPTPAPTSNSSSNPDTVWWFDTTWWFRTSDWWYASPDLTTKIWSNWSVYMWEPIYDPAIIWSYRLNDDWTAEFYWQWWSKVYVSDPKEYENMRATLQPRQKEWWEYLMKYNKEFQKQAQAIINAWWYIDAEWYLHRADWSVVTKL